MSNGDHSDLIVIGTGSAGSSGWQQATKLGKRVTVFERAVLGGECPTFACIPTKALLHCAEVFDTTSGASRFGIDVENGTVDYRRVKERKDEVVARTGIGHADRAYSDAGVRLIKSAARFVSPYAVEADGVRYSADRFLIATGSTTRIPETPGLRDVGFLTFKDAIDLTRLPRSILIVGGGPVGCEFAHLFSSFGARVVLIDHNEHLLPREDHEVGDILAQLFVERGVRILTRSSAVRFELKATSRQVTVEREHVQETLDVDEILIATGKRPVTDLGLDQAGISYDVDKGVVVDETLRTTNPVVYAAGDCVGPFRLTHVASYQGKLAIDNAFSTVPRPADYRAVPRCVFTSPEVAAVGMTEQQAREKGMEVTVGRAQIAKLDRASTAEQFPGFVKVLTDDAERLVGASIVAPRAGELIHELTLAVALGATANQVAAVIHAFPTYSEAIQVACADVKLQP